LGNGSALMGQEVRGRHWAQESSQAAREVKISDVGPSAIRPWRNHRTRIRRSAAAMPTPRDETALVVTTSHELNGTNELRGDLAGRGGDHAGQQRRRRTQCEPSQTAAVHEYES
jgi:hypothetical protein